MYNSYNWYAFFLSVGNLVIRKDWCKGSWRHYRRCIDKQKILDCRRSFWEKGQFTKFISSSDGGRPKSVCLFGHATLN